MKKNLITVLKKLLAAFGGEDTQSNNAVEIIDKIADSIEQGGGGLGPLILEFATEDPYTVTTPMSEIKAAIDAGRQVWFMYQGTGHLLVDYGLNNNNGISELYFGGDGLIYYEGGWDVN